MTMDAITEKIAHFIGAFELVEQEARMRAEYEKFRAIKAAEDDARAIELRSLKSKESYKLEDVDAGVKMKAPPPEAKASATEEMTPPPMSNPMHLPNGVPATTLDDSELIGPSGIVAPNAEMNFILPPPSSVAQVTYQANTLSDNDSFHVTSADGFQAVSTLIETLDSIYASVTSLMPMGMDLLPASANWSEVLHDIQDAAAAIGTGTNGTLATTVLQGNNAHGTFVDGVAVEEFMSFKDMQPAYVAEKIAKAEAAAEPHDPTEDGHDFDADFGKGENPFKLDEGHAVVAGANTLVNTASISSTWLDAEVIAVAGDVVRMDAISQVNVVIDHDSVATALSPAGLADQASTASNAAKIMAQTVADAKLATQEAAKEAGEEDVEVEAESDPESEPPILAQAPANWAVVRYEGSVTQINWVKQNTFTTDYDQAVATFSGGATFLGMGENSLSNSFDINEIGYHYDLILVGGDLIDINMISQLNIILDSDVVDTSTPETIAATEVTDTVVQAELQPEIASETVETDVQTTDAPSITLTGTRVDGTSQQAEAISGLTTDQTNEEDVGDQASLEITDPETAAQETNPVETASEKTAVVETASAELAVAETASADTATAGTASAKTAVAEAESTDTAVAGTASAETAVVETASAETAVAETAASETAQDETAVLDDPLPSSPPLATDSALSTGDNLAYNQAVIETIGQDTDAEISQIYADVLAGYAQGNDDIPDEVLEDSSFLGTELLRVLYIDGDFTTINMVDQVNVLGDADQVHLARDTFADDLQDMIEVTTGSNITANIAAIQDNGMDSTVMAEGDTYSDALIYQANLIDTDLMETGTSIADLANEAVAFLTDDMGADALGDDIASMTHGIIADAMDQSDVMQTMLS